VDSTVISGVCTLSLILGSWWATVVANLQQVNNEGGQQLLGLNLHVCIRGRKRTLKLAKVDPAIDVLFCDKANGCIGREKPVQHSR
jgi:hypothetical protein